MITRGGYSDDYEGGYSNVARGWCSNYYEGRVVRVL